MKYLAMLKKEESTQSEALQKLQEPLFAVNAVPQGASVSEKQAPLDPAPMIPEPVAGDDWYDDMVCMAIQDLNDAGAEYMHASEEDRNRARRLEWEYTEAANASDSAQFLRALIEWRQTWLKTLH